MLRRHRSDEKPLTSLNSSPPAWFGARKVESIAKMVRSVRREMQIIVIDDGLGGDLNSLRPIWKTENVTLLGPFTSESLCEDILRRSDGVLISVYVDGQQLVQLTHLLQALRVPFLFTVRGRSNAHFSLDADENHIAGILEALLMQEDDGMLH
jgi:hypothetical protein